MLDLGTKHIPINRIIEVYQAFINIKGDWKVTEYLVLSVYGKNTCHQNKQTADESSA